MKGHRTDWEDGYEGAHNGRGDGYEWGTVRTGNTTMKGHRTDWEDAMKGHITDGETAMNRAQNGLGTRR